MTPIPYEEIMPEPRSSGIGRATARVWPAPMAPEARHGFIGEVLETIEPHTEADPHALLVQMLVAFGNVIGRGAGFKAEADFHSTVLYAVIVGETAKARKGTSLGYIRKLIATADSDYVEGRVEGGLSSGEGLVYAVRDAATRMVHPRKDDEGALGRGMGRGDRRPRRGRQAPACARG